MCICGVQAGQPGCKCFTQLQPLSSAINCGVCVCVKRARARARASESESEREGERERKKERKRDICVCVFVCVCVCTHLSTCTDITGRQAPNPLPNKCETCKTYCEISRPPFHICPKRSRVTGTLHGLMKTNEGAIESTIQNLCRGIPLEEC